MYRAWRWGWSCIYTRKFQNFKINQLSFVFLCTASVWWDMTLAAIEQTLRVYRRRSSKQWMKATVWMKTRNQYTKDRSLLLICSTLRYISRPFKSSAICHLWTVDIHQASIAHVGYEHTVLGVLILNQKHSFLDVHCLCSQFVFIWNWLWQHLPQKIPLV